jgi:radical SAM superfamily enzyme YgiQ (UPF0313 family)
MARILFVSLYDRNAYGQRLMSASLKRHGHDCAIVFLKRYDSSPSAPRGAEAGEHAWIGIDNRGREFLYAANSPIRPRELELLRDVVRRVRPDLVGLTVNTPLRLQASRVTRFIQGFCDAPLVWGGYDPTINPAACLEICDYACIGEGDTTILELAAAMDRGEGLERVPNLAFRRDGSLVFAPRAPLVRDLDSLPWRDNEPENKYFIEDGRLVEHYPVLNDRRPGSYQTMTSRGCPYSCTYCCEASLKELYAGERFLRRRSPADCVAELAEAKVRFNLQELVFEDEIFGMDFRWLSEFTPRYVDHVGLPFIAYLYPSRNVDKLLPLLQLAGLKQCCVALESGSARINRTVFGRVYDRELLVRTVRLCKSLGIDYYTDVITFNPYEEESDLKDTLEVLLEIGGRLSLCLNKLSVLPGTRLAERMARDGVTLSDPSKERLFHYYSRLFWTASFSPNSRWVVRLIERLRLFRRRPEWLSLGLVEWFLCGPIGRTIDAVVRYRQRRTRFPRGPEPWPARLRRLAEPPEPLVRNPAEPGDFRTGRWNLFLGGAGRYVRGMVNLDLHPAPGVDVAADSEFLPFQADVFQRIECDAVLEHVPHPAAVVREIERVLAPGGYARLVTAFCHPLQQDLNDYRRFTLDGLKQMAGGLEVVAEGWRTGPTATMIVLFLEYIKLLAPWRWWRIASHGVLGWLLFPLRYLDLILFRSPRAGRMGNHCYLWLRKPYRLAHRNSFGR